MKINKNSEPSKKVDKVLKSSVLLGATLLASNIAGTVSAHAVEVHKDTMKPSASTSNNLNNGLIDEETLSKYTMHTSNLSICASELNSIKLDRMSIELYNQLGKPVPSNQYSWKITRIQPNVIEPLAPVRVNVDFTLRNGQKLARTFYVNLEDDSALQEGKVSVADLSKTNLNIEVPDNCNEDFKKNAINSVIRRGVFKNHKGMLKVNTLTDVNKAEVLCDATLYTANGDVTPVKNIRVHVVTKPHDASLSDTVVNTSPKPAVVSTSDKPVSKPVPDVTPTRLKNSFPVISGADLHLNVGDRFNINMIKIKAYDTEDGDLTSKVHVANNYNVDTSKAGVYEVKTWVDDKDGAQTVRYFKVHVEAPKKVIEEKESTKPQPKPIEKKTEKVTAKEDTSCPTLDIYNFSINQGDKITQSEALELSHAKAIDKTDGNITNKIVFDSLTDIKTSAPGSYKVLAYVVNSKGNKTKSYINVTVNREKTAYLTLNVIDSKTGNVLDKSTAYKLKAGSTFSKSVIPDSIMKNYILVNARVNGVMDKSLTGVVIPGENIISLYVDKNEAKPTTPVTNMVNSKDAKPIEKVENNTSINHIIKNTPPTIIGKNLRMSKGDTFKLSLLDLKALDIEDGDITENIETISSNVDTSKAGSYKVGVSVKDKNGSEVTKEFHVDVVDSKALTQPNTETKVKPVEKKVVDKTSTKVKKSDSKKTNNPTKDTDKSEQKLYQTGIDTGKAQLSILLGSLASIICLMFGLKFLVTKKDVAE